MSWMPLAARISASPSLAQVMPVAPADTIAELSGDCDEIVCLFTPEPFYAVGAHYRDFTQTTDEEVIRLLAEARRWSPADVGEP